ncbi:bifunctional aspartate kinase/homoserine dehydrogenase I, partial [candidate division KSB1 bacterium]|nr:bifunctional aspartate kinase/homoserine dehydrogenase I [candidate division KSB1 bacterium]
RGGSDFTASIFGAALDADEIQIWTDVNGVMTSNPVKVPAAFPLKTLSYEEAMELSHFGAKVLHPPTIQPALEQNISLKIMNTFKQDFPGTIIQKEPEANNFIIKGISSIQDITLLRIQGSGMIGVPGIASRIFSTLAREQINIILITQASSEHSICVAVVPEKAAAAKKMIEAEFELELRARMVDPVIIEKDLSIIAIVGNNMRHTPGIAGRMFSALGANGINVIAIAQGSSELNISVVISRRDETRALNVLHQAFFFPKIKTVPLFIVGATGLIGSTLLKQLFEQRKALMKKSGIDFQIHAVADINKMMIAEKALEYSQIQKLSEAGETTDMSKFIRQIQSLKFSGKIFIDCTASENISACYEELFDAGISVVTPNKLANTGSWDRYQEMRRIAEKRDVHFMYETNIGAGLPVISTIRDLVSTGDKIVKFEAILSGTLAYIFNTFSGSMRFSDVVKDAKAKGYTEPDPRIDLKGTDVARKLLLLVREIGMPLEMTDINVEQFLPESCLSTSSVNDFFAELKKEDDHFAELQHRCCEEGTVLRHIASFENGSAEVALKEVDGSHPFYMLSGSDNIIAFTTKRYPNPLVIKGAGAGAEVTAAGVFADLIKVGLVIRDK